MVHELVGIQNGRVTIDAESRKDLKVGGLEIPLDLEEGS